MSGFEPNSGRISCTGWFIVGAFLMMSFEQQFVCISRAFLLLFSSVYGCLDRNEEKMFFEEFSTVSLIESLEKAQRDE
jgi:hypothetical protein